MSGTERGLETEREEMKNKKVKELRSTLNEIKSYQLLNLPLEGHLLDKVLAGLEQYVSEQEVTIH